MVLKKSQRMCCLEQRLSHWREKELVLKNREKTLSKAFSLYTLPIPEEENKRPGKFYKPSEKLKEVKCVFHFMDEETVAQKGYIFFPEVTAVGTVPKILLSDPRPV